MVANSTSRQLPPRLSCSNQVNFESLYGMYFDGRFVEVRALKQPFKAARLELISELSLMTSVVQ